MNQKLLDYFNGDELAANVWLTKYAAEGEETPDDMHWRLANEFGRIEKKYQEGERELFINGYKSELSEYGRSRLDLSKKSIFNLFKDFKYIIPQGRVMAGLGIMESYRSLSNCTVLPSPKDSYNSIMKTDTMLVNSAKRGMGYGLDISNLRPRGANVSNAAKSSTGAVSFMERFSNSTREVAQSGRRGACLMSININHPDIEEFINIKKDLTKITGANISIKLNDEFINAVKNNEDYVLRFPENAQLTKTYEIKNIELGKLYEINGEYFKYVSAKELWDKIIKAARDNSEPGLFMWDNVIDRDPSSVYEKFKPICTNACGEEPMAFGDTCRLICINLFSFVNNPFTENASVDYKKVYEICYEQLRLGDDLVDLEIEYIKRIINKIQNENDNDSDIELEMWTNTLNVAKEGRRTGCGLTGLGDMLAGLNLKYDSKEAIDVVEKVMRTKFKAELDCSIDLSILRGPFKAWDKKLEYKDLDDESNEDSTNSFYSFLKENFKEECARMYHWGRRNINWSTVSPTGSVSILTQTTSGCEPLFQPFYMRRKKVNPDDENIRVDFTDQNGDTWQEYPVLHSKFKYYMLSKYSLLDLSTYSQEDLKREFEKSPWYNSTANDINWNKRIEMQSILQKYTTAAISSTINLPENVSEKTVEEIYLNAWNIGLKGVTIYRDGSRSGVLVSKKEEKKDNFFTVDAFKRQNPTAAQSYITSVNGEKYTVIIGCINNNPYEVFAMKGSFFNRQDGEIYKISSGNYSFVTNKNNYEEIQFNMNDVQEDTCKMISGMLRHRMSVKYIVDILTKGSGEITGFNKAIARILKKYIKNGEKIDKKCSECGSASLTYQEGCLMCNNCGYSKC